MPDDNKADNKKQWMTMGIVILVTMVALGVVFFFLGKGVGKAYTGGVGSAGIENSVFFSDESKNLLVKAKLPSGKESISLGFRMKYDRRYLREDTYCQADKIFSELDKLSGYGTANDLTLIRTVSCNKGVSNTNYNFIEVEYAWLCNEDCSNALKNNLEEVTLATLSFTGTKYINTEYINTEITFESSTNLPGSTNLPDIVVYDAGGASLVSSAGTTEITIIPADVDGDGSPANLDCDDKDPTRFPGNKELCDRKDNDCDANTADGAGEDPQDASLNVGVCLNAKKVCTDGAMVDPVYADISGYETYEATCDGKDNDCDGYRDNTPNTQIPFSLITPASEVKGLCSGNVLQCTEANGWEGSSDNYVPQTEVCSGGQDEDCNGLVDCADTTNCPVVNNPQCEVVVCGDNVRGSTEACDDGNTMDRDGCSSTCTLEDLDNDGFTRFDASGAVSDCDDKDHARFPHNQEICDGKDNDCDLSTPDGAGEPRPADLNKGVCSNAKKVCTVDGMVEPNYAEIQHYQSSETSCSDNLDNDCDGFTDIIDIDCINAELTPDEALDTLLGRMLFTAKVGRKIKEVTKQ